MLPALRRHSIVRDVLRIVINVRAVAGFGMWLPVHSPGLGVHPFGICDDPRWASLQFSEVKQAAFAGKFQSFKPDASDAGKLFDFVRRALPEVREDGAGLGFRRLGMWPRCVCRGRG